MAYEGGSEKDFFPMYDFCDLNDNWLISLSRRYLADEFHHSKSIQALQLVVYFPYTASRYAFVRIERLVKDALGDRSIGDCDLDIINLELSLEFTATGELIFEVITG